MGFMKRILLIFGILAIVVVGGVLLLNNNQEADKPAQVLSKSTVKEPSESQFDKIQDEIAAGSAKLYDVRTPEEFADSHFASAENFDVQKMQNGAMPDVKKSMKIYLHCRTGVRATDAAEILKQNGFSEVINLGGLTDVVTIGGRHESNE